MAVFKNVSDKQLGISKASRQVVLQPGEEIDLTVQDLISSGFNRTWLKAVVNGQVIAGEATPVAVSASDEWAAKTQAEVLARTGFDVAGLINAEATLVAEAPGLAIAAAEPEAGNTAEPEAPADIVAETVPEATPEAAPEATAEALAETAEATEEPVMDSVTEPESSPVAKTGKARRAK